MKDNSSTRLDSIGHPQGGVSGDAQAAPTNAPQRKRRRRRSRHKGVKLLSRKRKSGTTYVARWTDPFTGKVTDKSLSLLGLTTHEARTAWAEAKAADLQKLRLHASVGGVFATNVDLDIAINAYIADLYIRCRATTVTHYRESIDIFSNWLKDIGVSKTTEITRIHLVNFFDHWKALPCKVSRRGREVGRGTKLASERVRSKSTLNKGTRSLRTLLGWLNARDYVPQLNTDMIRASLVLLRLPKPRPTFLSVDQIGQLLSSCKDHDSATFKLRDEKKYTPVTEFILFNLLCGTRFSEARELRWAAIDFASQLVRLHHEGVKTNAGREIDLSLCPLLLELLQRMKLKSGGKEFVFGGDNHRLKSFWNAAKDRLMRSFSAPFFNWNMLRRTATTYLTNAPGIFGGASAFHAAKRCGHSVQVGFDHYNGVLRHISAEHHTLEAAMQIEPFIRDLLMKWSSPDDVAA
ncbi:MAG: tyrosine-type recombinase/integrase [Planctomycetes bacterium]|nr:tyrosine-type recombinase/integrase [Planctomycetota bacterium]MCW8134476.1 tyrosine-type recombinase/integrase [Planctomycetota bacterium]